MGMITFEEFDEAIANVAINAVFPTKKDLYMKPVYLHDNKDDKIGMTYIIMPFGSKRYYIGFIQEQDSSMFTVWNGKMDHIVFDVDERDGCIRYYHEPELYDRDNGLSHSQIQTIGETLIKYLTSNKEEKDNNEPEETKQRDDIKITFEQLSKIFREQLEILFPGKHISSNETKSKDMDSYEMQFHIVVKPGEPHLIIGFTKEPECSVIYIWNGKRMNHVIGIDTDDNFIRRYHEPKLYAESSICLGYSQVSAIYTALDTFLNCDDIVDERSVKYYPTILLEQIQTVIECWMKSNNIRGNGCESEAGGFYYDLWEGKFIKGTLISAGDEKEILIWMNTDTPVMRITPSVSSLIHTHSTSFTDEEIYSLYEEICEAAVLSEEKVTKKHPLQNSPTFPEEKSVEEKHYAIIDDTVAVPTEDKTWMRPGGKFGIPIDPFKMVPIFNTEALETNAPYIIKNLENNTTGIVTLRDCSADYVVFGLWNDEGEYIVEEFTVTEFNGAFELYTTNGVKVEL